MVRYGLWYAVVGFLCGIFVAVEAHRNGNVTLEANEALTSRFVKEASIPSSRTLSDVFSDELKAKLILRAAGRTAYEFQGFTFDSCLRVDTPGIVPWCRCLTEKLAAFPKVQLLRIGLQTNEYDGRISAAMIECKESTLDGTKANIGAICDETETLFWGGRNVNTHFCARACPGDEDLTDCGNRCVRELMPGFCSDQTAGYPSDDPVYEECIINIAAWKQNFFLFREVYPLPQRSRQWCQCLSANNLPIGDPNDAEFARIFGRCRQEVLEGSPVNLADICMGMYRWSRDPVRATFCQDLLVDFPRSRSRMMDCEEEKVRNLMPDYCSQYRLEYPGAQKNRESSPVTYIVVDGKSIGFRRTMETMGYNFYFNHHTRKVAQTACGMLFPDDPDACCSYDRGSVMFGTCCRNVGDAMRFDCSDPATYRGFELFYHCMEMNSGRYHLSDYADNLDIDPFYRLQVTTPGGQSPSHRRNQAFLNENLAFRGSGSDYHFPKKACGDFMKAYRALEYGQITLRRETETNMISAVIPDTLLNYLCSPPPEYENCCYEYFFGTFYSSVGRFFAQCTDTVAIPGGSPPTATPEVTPSPSPSPEDPCDGLCPSGMDCVVRPGARFCVDCGWYLKAGADEDDEVTCCRYSENKGSCRFNRDSSGKKKMCYRNEDIFMYFDGRKMPARFMREKGPICNNPWDLRRNGGACRIWRKKNGRYICRFHKRFRSSS